MSTQLQQQSNGRQQNEISWTSARIKNEIFPYLASNLGHDWKMFIYKLPHEGTFDAAKCITYAEMSNDPAAKNKILLAIEDWAKICPNSINMEAIEAALGKCGRNDMAEEIREEKAKQMTSPSDLLSKSGDQEKILYIPELDELPTGWPDPLKHDPLRIKVIKIPETEDGKQMKNLFEGAASGKYRIYPMLNSSRGIALIINNMDFQQARTANVNLADRKGSEYDQMALDMLFEQLGFKRVIRKDCTVQVMLDAVHEQVSVAGSTPQDCFVFVVLSHGERDHVFGVDGEKVHLDKFEEAVDSPLLINKPKLLFIQACQGDRGDTGIRHDGGKEISSEMPEMQNLHLREESDGASPQWVPSRADIFSAKATVPNYFSWRNVNWGTWFIQAVVFVFSNFAYKYDLTSLMIMVNDLVKKAKAGNFRQISTFTCSHTRSLYFFPGLTHSPLS